MEDHSKVFCVSPRAPGVKVGTRNLAVTPKRVKQKEDTMYTISMRSNSVESLEKKDTASSTKIAEPAARPKVSQETRGIAALAAIKKRQQQAEMSSRLNLQDSQFNQTFVSYDEVENGLTSSRLASHNHKFDSKFDSKFDLNDDLDSYEHRSQNGDGLQYGVRNNGPSPSKAGHKMLRGGRHKHQGLLRVQQQSNAVPLATSSSDRLFDSTANTPTKVTKALDGKLSENISTINYVSMQPRF